MHVLRNPWDEVQSGKSWTRCGAYALVAPGDEPEKATCLTCRASANLPKTLSMVELPRRVIPCLPDEGLQALTSVGWQSIRRHGKLEVRQHPELCVVRDVTIPLCPIPDYQGPQDLWANAPEWAPRGYHVLVLGCKGSYGALRSPKPLEAVKVACGAERASEGAPRLGKTWLERVVAD